MRSKRIIFDVFCADKRLTRFCSGFCIDFSQKINENLMKTSRYLFTPSLVFLNMATLTKHRILRCESYFFISRVLVFFLKKQGKINSKNQPTFFPQKTRKSGPGRPVLDPKMIRIHVREAKNPENGAKK